VWTGKIRRGIFKCHITDTREIRVDWERHNIQASHQWYKNDPCVGKREIITEEVEEDRRGVVE